MFALLAFLLGHLGRVCAAVEFTLRGKGLVTHLIHKQQGLYTCSRFIWKDDLYSIILDMVSTSYFRNVP